MSNAFGRGVLLSIIVSGCLAGCAQFQKHTDTTPPTTQRAVVPKGPPVSARIETLTIPTYPVGPASDFPEFGRTGQQRARSGLYPYTPLRNLSFDRKDQDYQAYVLENEYLKLTVLPSLGGRLFSMFDKSSQKEVVYRQVSIKPGLVALRGAWISGGIEWNFPRSHSVSTMDQVSCEIVHHPDGSAGIVVGDTERSFHTAWTVEMRLSPGQARMETHIIWRNPTSSPHDGYWWSNACFPATDQTQLIFPFYKTTGDSGGLSDWPIRDGKDVSWYKNYPNSSSIFRGAGDEDFFAAYDYGKDLALAQYADHNVLPGRKWFTWGNSEAGQTWAKTLSDDNKAYVEVQSGDPLTQGMQFHMQPHEQREYMEYWMPVSRIGPPARINPDAAVRLTVEDGFATVGVMTTHIVTTAHVQLFSGVHVLGDWHQYLSPANVLNEKVSMQGINPDDLTLNVFDEGGREIISHQYHHYAQGKPVAEPAVADDRPRGERRVDPDVEKFNKAVLDIWQGNFYQAQSALQPLAENTPKSLDADAVHYYLGAADARVDDTANAIAQFRAITTPGKLHDAALIEAAKLSINSASSDLALAKLASTGQAEAGALIAVADRLNDTGGARSQVKQTLDHDPLNAMAQCESAILDGGDFQEIPALRDEERRIELATGYMAIKQYPIAERLLRASAGQTPTPTALYLRAYILELIGGQDADVKSLRKQAAATGVRGCLPGRLDELAAFRAAIKADDKDANAHYFAGLVLYSRGRREDAVTELTNSAALEPKDAIIYDCLGGVIRDEKPAEAVKQFEHASALAPESIEILADLDYSYTLVNELPKRIAALEAGQLRMPLDDRVAQRLAIAYFDAGRYVDAIKNYQLHRFHVAEGQRDVHDYYAMSLVGLAMTHLQAGENKEALSDLNAAEEYPENLGIGKSQGASSAVVDYWRGVALENLGQADEAKESWQSVPRSARGERVQIYSPLSALNTVHAILAMRKLGETQAADDLAEQLDRTLNRLQRPDSPETKTMADIINAAFAADVNPSRAGSLLDQAQANPMQFGGYIRIARMWVEMLGKNAPKTPPASPAATMPG